jgi:uncharacterized membrane protein
MKHFNNWIAIKITRGVATMWCAYIFAVLAVAGFPGLHASVQNYVQWVSQTFIQLTMLSVIMVGQKLMTDIQKKNHKEMQDLHGVLHKHLGIKK